jgi:nicotinate-nucleotide pyrophosphorylase (carboxylating)
MGVLESREDCVLCGIPVAREVFTQLGGCSFPSDLSDGAVLKAGDREPIVVGALQSILTGERVALNFLQRLSAIATLTRRFVEAAPGVQIRDTRKTTPGLRALEKYAVAAGGGVNHRFGLFDAILIKDNHILAAGSLSAAVERARAAGRRPIQVECDTIAQVREALSVQADAILLDNMPVPMLEEAVRIVDCAAFTEASGGVTLDTVAGIAATGVDAVSVGALTHSAGSVDLSLDVRPE